MIKNPHKLATILIAFAQGDTVECRVRSVNPAIEFNWRKATLKDVANDASDLEFRVVEDKTVSS